MADKSRTDGIIECGKCYRLPEFQRISGMGPRAVRAAQAKGLSVIYVGRVGWIRGDDFHAYLGRVAEEQVMGMDSGESAES